jgi:uncharacterized protein
VASAIEERRREQERRLALARRYVSELSDRLPVEAAGVVGSVARGDFNVWSDVDAVVVAEQLPEDGLERTGLLLSVAPPGIQPVGFTPAELDAGLRRRNPMLVELLESGRILAGAEWLRSRAPD